jgi:hypothetical protein
MNGTDYGAITRYSVDNIKEISRRIITTNGTGSTELIRFMPSASAGQYINTDVRYLRVTNLDNSNFTTLRLKGLGGTDYACRLDPTSSYLVMTTQPSGSTNACVTGYGDIYGITMTSLKNISSFADTCAVDLELFVASV